MGGAYVGYQFGKVNEETGKWLVAEREHTVVPSPRWAPPAAAADEAPAADAAETQKAQGTPTPPAGVWLCTLLPLQLYVNDAPSTCACMF